jgi:hypothetical protein
LRHAARSRSGESRGTGNLRASTAVRARSKTKLAQTQGFKPWARIEQALRVTDLLLQAGGFSAIVLDMASIAPEHVSRVPLATWFRYRAAAERTRASVLLLTQHSCAKSSSGTAAAVQPGEARMTMKRTVFTGIEHRLEVERRRFAQADKCNSTAQAAAERERRALEKPIDLGRCAMTSS